MRLSCVGCVALLTACAGTGVDGRWQGVNDPASAGPVAVAFTLRTHGDSLRGWGVAQTDGRSFPIAVRGILARDTIALVLAPWRSGVIDIESAQLSGRLRAEGDIAATLRTDGGLGLGPATTLTLRRPP